ncbi:MAG: hypothetical protein AAFO74_13115 [Pseudomonadota bacterium]
MTTPNQTTRLRDAIAEIDALFEKATARPWVADCHVAELGSGEDDRAHVIGSYGNYAKQCLVRELSTMEGNSLERQHADAKLIALLVTSWPLLRSALLDVREWQDGRKSTGMRDEEDREIFEGDWIQFNVTFFDGNFKDEPISGKIVYVPELMSFQLVNVQSDYWRQYTGGDDSTYAPFSELNFTEADLRIIDPPQPPAQDGE